MKKLPKYITLFLISLLFLWGVMNFQDYLGTTRMGFVNPESFVAEEQVIKSEETLSEESFQARVDLLEEKAQQGYSNEVFGNQKTLAELKDQDGTFYIYGGTEMKTKDFSTNKMVVFDDGIDAEKFPLVDFDLVDDRTIFSLDPITFHNNKLFFFNTKKGLSYFDSKTRKVEELHLGGVEVAGDEVTRINSFYPQSDTLYLLIGDNCRYYAAKCGSNKLYKYDIGTKEISFLDVETDKKFIAGFIDEKIVLADHFGDAGYRELSYLVLDLATGEEERYGGSYHIDSEEQKSPEYLAVEEISEQVSEKSSYENYKFILKGEEITPVVFEYERGSHAQNTRYILME